MRETSDRRVIAALRFIDAATEQPLTGALNVSGTGMRFTRNLSGMYVLVSAPGFEEYTRSWEAPPAEPPVGSIALSVDISDPSRRYLARRATLSVPRDPNPANRAQASSLFQPVVVRMFPSPALPTEPNWSLIRVRVRRREPDEPIAGALIVVRDRGEGGQVRGRGLSGPLGEALVAVASIQLVRSGEGGAVLVRDVPVTLEAIAGPATSAPPDPDDLEARRGELERNSIDLSITAGQTQDATIVVPAGNP